MWAFLENSCDFGSQFPQLRVKHILGLAGQTQRSPGSSGSYLFSGQLFWLHGEPGASQEKLHWVSCAPPSASVSSVLVKSKDDLRLQSRDWWK